MRYTKAEEKTFALSDYQNHLASIFNLSVEDVRASLSLERARAIYDRAENGALETGAFFGIYAAMHAAVGLYHSNATYATVTGLIALACTAVGYVGRQNAVSAAREEMVKEINERKPAPAL